MVTFAHDTIVVVWISVGGHIPPRDEVMQLTVWCRDNNQLLYTKKTKECIVNFRKKKTDIQPIFINRLYQTSAFWELTSWRTCPGVQTQLSW